MTANDADIKASICVVTYNQVEYVEQCLQSLIDQITNFEFEIIVGDDFSTDGTRTIVEDFQRKYPHIIKPIFHSRNVGAAVNFNAVHGSAKGKFVAHVDGDDYMLPNKLQSQVDFMERNPNCNISWHRMYVSYGSNIKEDLLDLSNFRQLCFTRADILKFITIGMNSSKMYRAETMNFQRPDFPMLDYFANVEQIGDGKACFISSDPLGVYRAGIGIAKNDFRVKEALNSSFLYFLSKYPMLSNEINQSVLLLLLMAFKNRRYKELSLFLKVYLKSFSFFTPWKLYKDYEFIKMLRLPK